jgi:hypothetical protein
MRILIAITLVCLLGSCLKLDQNQNESTYVLQAILLEGLPVENIKLSQIAPLGATNDDLPVSGAIVTIHRNGVQLEPLVEDQNQAGFYFHPDNSIIISAGDEFEISVNVEGSILTSHTVVPQSIQDVFLTETNIFIDSENGANDPVVNIEFNGLLGHATLITLNSLESEPELIPFEQGGGNFALSYALPQPFQEEMEFTMYANDFLYYGSQELKFYRIADVYSEAFVYSPNGPGIEVLNVPDNVEGGSGFFTSATVESKVITISEQ